MNKIHWIKVGQMLEQLKKEIKLEQDNKKRQVFIENLKRMGEK